jgi:hypothetical protein
MLQIAIIRISEFKQQIAAFPKSLCFKFTHPSIFETNQVSSGWEMPLELLQSD